MNRPLIPPRLSTVHRSTRTRLTLFPAVFSVSVSRAQPAELGPAKVNHQPQPLSLYSRHAVRYPGTDPRVCCAGAGTPLAKGARVVRLISFAGCFLYPFIARAGAWVERQSSSFFFVPLARSPHRVFYCHASFYVAEAVVQRT